VEGKPSHHMINGGTPTIIVFLAITFF
jgi:hypothetical protein